MVAYSLSSARSEAKRIVNSYAGSAAAVGWVPGSCVFLSGLQLQMCDDIANCFGVTAYTGEQVLTLIGTNLTGHTIADIGLSIVPGIGWAVKSGTAAAITKACGELLIEYFAERSPLY